MRHSQQLQYQHLEALLVVSLLQNHWCLTELTECNDIITTLYSHRTHIPMQYSHVMNYCKHCTFYCDGSQENSNPQRHHVQRGWLKMSGF